jgi:hypothetical protein
VTVATAPTVMDNTTHSTVSSATILARVVLVCSELRIIGFS